MDRAIKSLVSATEPVAQVVYTSAHPTRQHIYLRLSALSVRGERELRPALGMPDAIGPTSHNALAPIARAPNAYLAEPIELKR